MKKVLAGLRPHGPRVGGAAGAGVMTVALCLLAPGAMSADQPVSTATSIDGARAALERWVEVRRVISAERRDWALGREMLGERIELVEQEIAGLRTKIGETEGSIAESDRKRLELVAQTERLAAASSVLEEMVSGLEARTRELLRRLPAPIRERVRPLSQRMPEEQAAADQTGRDGESARPGRSLGERFQNVVGILNEVNKFNREITITSEVRSLPDGTSAEVAALYVGIGHGYYVSGDGTVAGVGTATDEGWLWTAANHAAPEIARAIAIVKNDAPAAFVRLPLKLDP